MRKPFTLAAHVLDTPFEGDHLSPASPLLLGRRWQVGAAHLLQHGGLKLGQAPITAVVAVRPRTASTQTRALPQFLAPRVRTTIGAPQPAHFANPKKGL